METGAESISSINDPGERQWRGEKHLDSACILKTEIAEHCDGTLKEGCERKILQDSEINAENMPWGMGLEIRGWCGQYWLEAEVGCTPTSMDHTQKNGFLVIEVWL